MIFGLLFSNGGKQPLTWQLPWVELGIGAVIWNLVAVLASTEQRTAQIIRFQNDLLYTVFHREANLKRTAEADAIAAGTFRLLRPLMLLVVNLVVVALAIGIWRKC